jgi:hypothetical protein
MLYSSLPSWRKTPGMVQHVASAAGSPGTKGILCTRLIQMPIRGGSVRPESFPKALSSAERAEEKETAASLQACR